MFARQNHLLLSVGLICSLLVCFSCTQSSNAARLHAPTTVTPPASLVKDIDATPGQDGDSAPNQFVAVGDTTFFVAEDDTNARELWKTDGTQAGTTLVRDIIPGGYDQSGPYGLIAFSNALFFATSVEYGPTTLWRSDGTANGTLPVMVMPDDTNSLYGMTVINGRLLFFATTALYPSANVPNLYSSDGTAAGTTRIKQIAVDFDAMIVANNQLFFVAKEGATGSELWKSDGTVAGTTLVKDIQPGPNSAFNSPYAINSTVFTILGNKLFFVANDGTTGNQLWQSDGTADGTTLVKEIPPDSGGLEPRELTVVGTTLFFVAQSTLWRTDGSAANTVQIRESDGSVVLGVNHPIAVGNQLFFWQAQYNFVLLNTSLWKSDGTDAGTVQIKSFDPKELSNPSPFLKSGYGQGVIGNKLLFVSNGDVWVSDGSADGTYFLKEMFPYQSNVQSGSFISFQGALLFKGGSETGVAELWKSDGTATGTLPITVGASGKHIYYPENFTIIGAHFFFALGQPYMSDDTPFGVFQLAHINASGASSFSVWQSQNAGYRMRAADTISFKSMLFFSANNSDGSTNGLWKSDGTEAGTSLVKAFTGDYGDKSLPFDLTIMNDTLFFATTTKGVWYLWKSDGSEQGTVIVKQYNAYNFSNGIIDQLTNVNGTLFFTAIAPSIGKELWKSDGTTDGTVVVKDITPGIENSQLEQLTAMGNLLFFFDDNGSRDALWKSDGTEAGTVMVKPPDKDGGISYTPSFSLIVVDSTLFFKAADADHGSELWKSDGTDAGTVLVKDINPGSANSFLSNVIALNNTLYFTANDGTHGYELWKSDGTESGTVLVRDINPGADLKTFPSGLHAVGSIVLFLADDGTHGTELWKSDGSEAGTVMVKDLVPGAQHLELPFFEATPLSDGKRALIDAYTPDGGIELWVTDGTPDGTLQVQDIAPGPASSDPSNITVIGDRAFFIADDTVHGRELWSLYIDDLPIPQTNVSSQTRVFLPSVQR